VTTELALLGLGAGLGLVLVARAVLAEPRTLEAALDRYRLPELAGIVPSESGAVRRGALPGWFSIGGLGTRLAGVTRRADAGSRDQDLAVTGRTIERHGMSLAWCCLGGAGCPAALVAGLAALGTAVPVPLVAALVPAGAAAGVLAGGLELRRTAGKARARFLRALTSWLELVSLAQAGGMGIEGALEAASRISSDPAFAAITTALADARRAGSSPWAGMARLGQDLGIVELDELAASLGLAGAEGARIRSSLTAKSAALRRRQMAEAEARANSTTERLFIPSIILMLGFMVFLMYPAAVSLAHVI
jgi:Flp pilus assembly protein TadB